MIWVTLVPKFEGAMEIKDYRPISMVGCVEKVNCESSSTKDKQSNGWIGWRNTNCFCVGEADSRWGTYCM